MIHLTVARKYARALLEIGLKAGNFEILGQELGTLAELLERNRELKAILFSAVYPVATQKKIVRAVAEPLGLSPATLDFLALLIDRKRMDHFPEVAKAYEALCDEAANRVRAVLIAAWEISPELTKIIKGKLEYSTGKEVILTVQKDPSLMGGVVTKMGNVVYDGSLRTQLQKIRENLCKE